jgi:uncharacterized integral membrane protein
MHAKLILAAILFGLLLVFMAQNYEVVAVRFLFWKLEMSRAVMLLGVLAMGAVIGWSVSGLSRLSRKRAATKEGPR